ncbi:MAG: glycerophosphodiester phosphodiesterase family protein [Sphingobacteriaceae bacterium]
MKSILVFKYCLTAFFLSGWFCAIEVAAQAVPKLTIKNAKELRNHFKYRANQTPLVFAHRGGASKGYPENCIATFEHTLKTITPYFEIDPRLTKDSVIVVLHDATLDRTTTGTGKLSDYTWEEVKKLKLKDPEGNVTSYGVPTLEEVLKWGKGKALLMLDRKDVPLPMLADKIKQLKAESHVMVSAYTLEEAKYHYSQNKNIMMEAFIKTPAALDNFSKSGIPWENIVAYVSQPKKKEFYNSLHEKGVMCMVYTATVIEKIKSAEERVNAYRSIINEGGDILLSDAIKEVTDTVYPMRTVDTK